MMADRMDTQGVGLDVGLAFIRWLTGADNLHYGLWTGLEVTASNLRQAQDAYTAKLFGYLPPGRLRILDIGGGAGETAKKLLALGHSVENIKNWRGVLFDGEVPGMAYRPRVTEAKPVFKGPVRDYGHVLSGDRPSGDPSLLLPVGAGHGVDWTDLG